MTRTYAILIAIAFALIGAGMFTVYILHIGERAEVAKQAVAQVKHDQKVKKDYEKIDRQTPYGGSDASIAAFLLAHARADK